MQIDQSDFRNWHDHPVTLKFKEDMIEAIDTQLAFLSTDAGLNSNSDRWRAGLIMGLRALVEWVPQIEETEDAVSGEGSSATD